MITYKLSKEFSTQEPNGVIKFNNENFVAWIPMNEDNTDYQEYLKWVAEGNEPLPADE